MQGSSQAGSKRHLSSVALLQRNPAPRLQAKLHACLSANVVYRDATRNQLRGGVNDTYSHVYLPLWWNGCVGFDAMRISTKPTLAAGLLSPPNSAVWHFPITLT
jgi:hypothetical protein